MSSPSSDGAAVYHRIAVGLAEWLQVFWIPTKTRKHPTAQLSIVEEGSNCGMCLRIQDTTNTREYWAKALSTALKKIVVEDLGNMLAAELWPTIPLHDSSGRGREDLQALEKDSSVKVVFLERHIVLVGQQSKLDKKVFVIRNMLQHYHWRLTGKER